MANVTSPGKDIFEVKAKQGGQTGYQNQKHRRLESEQNLLFSAQALHAVAVEMEAQRGEATFLSHPAGSGEAGENPST